MIMLSAWRGPFHDHLVFFPTRTQVRALAARCRPYEVFRSPHVSGTAPGIRTRVVGRSATNCIDLTQPAEALLRDMDAKSCRHEIRRAEKLGDRLRFRTNDHAALADYFNLYNSFVEWKGYTKPLSQRRYARYLGICDVTVAYFDDLPVAGHLLVADADASRVRLVFSASSRFVGGTIAKFSGPVNRWLHWQEFLRYGQAGLATYDFGGGWHGSIGHFKRSFGGEMEEGDIIAIEGALVRAPMRGVEAMQRFGRARR